MFILVCSNKDGSIKIKSIELEKMIEGRKQNQPTIFENGIVLNWNMYAGVVLDKEVQETVKELLRYGKTPEEARAEVENKTSPFAKILSDKMKMLSDKSRTEIQEETAKKEREAK